MARILLVSTIKENMFIAPTAQLLVKSHEVYRYSILEHTIENCVTGKKHTLGTGNSIVSIVKTGRKVKNFLGSIDYIHYHFITKYTLLLNALVFYSISTKYATIWGSDFYKSSNKNPFRSRFFKSMDKITCTNYKTGQDFISFYAFAKAKIETIPFGLEVLDYIDAVQHKDSRVELGLNMLIPYHNKKIVCIGTNGSKNQNHLLIISAIAKLEHELLDQIVFLVPAGYPRENETYLEQIEHSFRDHEVPHFFIDRAFYEEEKLGHYRKIADVLIQLQTTDQFSGSMQESLYAGTQVITGSWLPYGILRENNIHWIEVDKIDQIVNVLPNAFNTPLTPDQINKNREVIYNISSWEGTASKWQKLYSL